MEDKMAQKRKLEADKKKREEHSINSSIHEKVSVQDHNLSYFWSPENS